MSSLQQLLQRYYRFATRFFCMHKHTKLLSIDFNQPWWHLLKQQRVAIAIVILFEGLNNIFLAMPALILEYFLTRHASYFGYFILLWAVMLLLEFFSDFFATRTMVQCLQSVYYAANRRLLEVDPIFHQSSSKGRVIAKIYRGAEAYQELFRAGVYELLSMIMGVATVIISFLTIDYTLGLLALGLLSILCTFSVALFLFTAHVFVPVRIEADDRVKNISTESLTQIGLIRSTFSTQQIDEKMQEVNRKRLAIEGNALRTYDIISSLTKIAYVTIFALIGFYILRLTASGIIAQSTGIALLITFFSGTYQLLQVARFIYSFKDQLVRVKDLFAFMYSYGEQSFPVMYTGATKVSKGIVDKNGDLHLQIRAIKFRYKQDAPLFSGHSLVLTVSREQENKLYGIIGYSGQGKSTLLAMIGGQLKPDGGTVKINGTNVYTTTDVVRRSLVTLQTQSASGFYGSIRYNLTFGLPKNYEYTDQELISVLERVGLWPILRQKRGLDTKVSEGGLALSSGQRQRLDFASVYLRARCYKPAFVLLDEPTSNLDEENEQLVITMIQELARASVVFVVSHRLRTLEKTDGLLDLSLIDLQDGGTRELRFTSSQELIEQSAYYKQLLSGNIQFALSRKKPYVDSCRSDLIVL